MTFSFAGFSVVLFSVVCLTPMRAQVVDDEVVCAVGVKWSDGEIRLDDLVSGTISIIATVGDNLNSMTRDESSGIFYFGSGQTRNVWKYDPCNGNNNVTKIGPISGITSGFTSHGLAYCVDDNGLYMTFQSSLYSIDLDNVDATLIGSVETTVIGLECDNNGDLYGLLFSGGLVEINKNNANVTVINSNVPNLLYLTYDPNNDNVLYGSDYDGNIVEINKTSGAYNVTNLIDDGTSAVTAYRGMIILDQDSCNAVTDCPMKCEYGMYDHSDSNNSQLLSEGWVPLTFDELSGDYKDNFISYYNLNGGLEALLSWSSGNCCFSFSESNDVQFTINLGSNRTDCHVYPTVCNPSGGYTQGRIYSFYSQNGCNNGSEYFTTIPSGVTIGTTDVCQRNNNPGIWRQCVIPTYEPTLEPTPLPTPSPTPSPTDTTDNPISTSDEGVCPNLTDTIDDCSEDPNCVSCSSWGGCNECADGYWLFQYNFACQACSKIDNCDTCNWWIGCQTCDPDYTITWVEQCPLAQGGVSTIATCA